MKNILLILLNIILLPLFVFSQIPDKPISPVEAINMLGKGILFEPQSGDWNGNISAPYKSKYGDIIKDTGFKSVRIRYQGDKNPMIKAIAQGPPYDANDDKLLDELEFIIDDVLSKELAPVITFYGLTNDNPGDYDKMISWWGYVANRFKNKSHRLIFNLFIEPYNLLKNEDPHRIMDYYEAITTEIRKTNPTRLLIYFAIQPENRSDNPYGPGIDFFNTKAYNPVPADAGIYYIWDFHVLKSDAMDNIRLVQQAWEYMDSTKQAVWSGAWDSMTDEREWWYGEPIAINVNRRFIDRGIPYAYLMMFDGHTSIFDAQIDHDGDGILEEWIYDGLEKTLTSGPDIWCNLLSNPGFEQNSKYWNISAESFSVNNEKENNFLKIASTSGKSTIKQNITLALKNNGPGKYDVLAYAGTDDTANASLKFIISGKTTEGNFEFKSENIIIPNNSEILSKKIETSWTGDLLSAELEIEINGKNVYLDKLGLTRFFYENPDINIEIWPGERIHHDNYTNRSNAGLELTAKFRDLMKEGVKNGNQDIINFSNKIESVKNKLEDRLIELIGNDYTRTSLSAQYRLNGYNPGNSNSQYKNIVEKYIYGKDNIAYQYNNQLKNIQDEARDYFILNGVDFRLFFYDVYKAFPPAIFPQTDIDTSVIIDGNSLKANESDATYRWCDCDLLQNPIGGATEQSFSPEKSGRYCVKITKNDYTFPSGCHFIEIKPTITENEHFNNIKIYPNPIQNKIFIKSDKIIHKIQLVDINGRIIKKISDINSTISTVDVDISNGLYILELFMEKGIEFKKIIKSN